MQKSAISSLMVQSLPSSLLNVPARTSDVQALHHGAQLPARSSPAVLGRPLPTSLRHRFSAASQVRQSMTPGHILPRHRFQVNVRPTGFSVAGPSAWNLLPDNLRDPSVTRDSFCRLLKTHLFAMYWSIQRIRGFTKILYTILLLTYLQAVKK